MISNIQTRTKTEKNGPFSPENMTNSNSEEVYCNFSLNTLPCKILRIGKFVSTRNCNVGLKYNAPQLILYRSRHILGRT